jgi:N-methylhydantoinase A
VSSIGIGGGSIARVDAFGVLKVGPESAGSLPGPAAYGRGGTEATVTDAMVVCGYLGYAPLAYGQLEVNKRLARQAVARIADALGRGVEEAAEAILDVAVSEMFVEVEKLASRYGVDLREFTLMPFGGGGPMLGCFLARELDMDRIIAPRRPGVVSALGGLVADLKGDFIQTLLALCDETAMPAVKAAANDLARRGRAWLREGQGFAGAISTQLSADMRYAGQSFEIEVPLQDDWIEAGDIEAIRTAFHARHHDLYDFNDPSGAVEFVNLRLVAVGETPALQMPSYPPVGGEASAAREIEVFQDGRRMAVPLYHRADLKAEQRFKGPAVVAQEDTTVAIPAGFSGRVDSYLNIHLSRAE